MNRFGIALTLAALTGLGLSASAQAGDHGRDGHRRGIPGHRVEHAAPGHAYGHDHGRRVLGHGRYERHDRWRHDARRRDRRQYEGRPEYRRDHDHDRPWRVRRSYRHRAVRGYTQGIGFTVDGVTFVWSDWGVR